MSRGAPDAGSARFTGSLGRKPEVRGLRALRIRLSTVPDSQHTILHRLIGGAIEPNSQVVIDSLPTYREFQRHGYRPIAVGIMAVHLVLPWMHRVFAQIKRWALGVYHGLRPKHLQTDLDNFVFRWNRRRLRKSSLDTLLEIIGVSQSLPYTAITAGPDLRAVCCGSQRRMAKKGCLATFSRYGWAPVAINSWAQDNAGNR